MSSSKRYFEAGVYQSLKPGDTVSHVGIYDPALWNCCPSNLLSGSTLHPPPLPWVKKYTLCTACVEGGGSGHKTDITCRKVHLQVTFYRLHFGLPSMSVIFLRILPTQDPLGWKARWWPKPFGSLKVWTTCPDVSSHTFTVCQYTNILLICFTHLVSFDYTSRRRILEAFDDLTEPYYWPVTKGKVFFKHVTFLQR